METKEVKEEIKKILDKKVEVKVEVKDILLVAGAFVLGSLLDLF